MGHNRSRSRSPERRRDRSRSPRPRWDRSRSQERRRNRSLSKERRRVRRRSRERRDDRRRSPKPRERRGGSRELGQAERRGGSRELGQAERRDRSRSRERGRGARDVVPQGERDQRAMPPPAPPGPVPCFKCRKEGHMGQDCPNPEAGDDLGGRQWQGGGSGGEEKMAWGKPGEQEEEVPEKEVEPEFGLSGALAAETNKVNGVVLVHQEPPEARKPAARWRLYVFKNNKQLPDPLYIHRNSCYLFGRERRVADIPTDHPSCSKQHAVLQYRLTEKEGKDGMMKAAVRPYLMDLGSTNGTFLNGERLEPERYYELLETDMLKFGNSSREYVVVKEK